MKVELMFCEEIILQEIEDKHYTRKDVAITYAFCIDSSEDVHFGKINNAIVSRWSYSALHYIKRRAWKLRKGQGEKRVKDVEDLKLKIALWLDAHYDDACWAHLVLWAIGVHSSEATFGKDGDWRKQSCTNVNGDYAYCGKCVRTGRLKE